jgi:hypothetical protein
MQKPIVWFAFAGVFLFFLAVDSFSGNFQDKNFDFFMMWFCFAIMAILQKLNQLGERIENSQRLQTTAFRTLKK